MNTHTFLAGLLVLFIISCTSTLSSKKEYHENGSLYKSYYVDNDSLIQGVFQVYFEDGKTVFEKANYIDGRLEGLRTLYYNSGKPEIIEQYETDILSDTLKVFYPSGKLKKLEYYEHGVLTGMLTSFFEAGGIKEKVTYSENIENGPFTEYYENGHLKWEGNFLNGDNEIGELIQYNSNGVMVKKMMCDSLSVCRTFWTLDDGEILEVL